MKTFKALKKSGPPTDDLEFDNFRDQLHEEVRQLNNIIGEEDHILMGTLNTGPSIKSSDPEKNLMPDETETYTSWISSGYSAPYVTSNARCTNCKSNPITIGANEVIDHILLKGNKFSVSGMKRILDQSPPLSDLYGIQGGICKT